MVKNYGIPSSRLGWDRCAILNHVLWAWEGWTYGKPSFVHLKCTPGGHGNSIDKRGGVDRKHAFACHWLEFWTSCFWRGPWINTPHWADVRLHIFHPIWNSCTTQYWLSGIVKLFGPPLPTYRCKGGPCDFEVWLYLEVKNLTDYTKYNLKE